MKTSLVYVVSQNGHTLMPTKRFGKVRRLLKSGKAKVVGRKPFTIKLTYETREYTQPLILGIDPGGKEVGLTVRKESGELLHAAHLEARSTEVAENMKERSRNRRNRRGHHRKVRQRRAKAAKTDFAEKKYRIAKIKEELTCKHIKPKPIRFHNRARKKGWRTPTANHVLEAHKRLVEIAAKRLPVAAVILEYSQFDMQKLENPEIAGVEYQNGRKKGYANTQEYVLCRDKHTCQLCDAAKGNLQVHHVIWESEGGSDTPENLITLCEKCHKRVHRNPKVNAQVKALFAGVRKRYVPTTLLNSIMPAFHQWLCSRFPKVDVTYGFETKEKRRKLGWPKEHVVDAYLISWQGDAKIADVAWNDVEVYEYRQFRRHHRQLIHATRERNYKEGKAVVAQNRNKRTGQLKDSLADLVAKRGRQILASLQVLPGKKVVRSKFKEFRKGDVVRYDGNDYVVKGYGEMGRRLGLIGCDKYVLTKDCALIVRNTGMVCL